jgi:hypothetical protein
MMKITNKFNKQAVNNNINLLKNKINYQLIYLLFLIVKIKSNNRMKKINK